MIAECHIIPLCNVDASRAEIAVINKPSKK